MVLDNLGQFAQAIVDECGWDDVVELCDSPGVFTVALREGAGDIKRKGGMALATFYGAVSGVLVRIGEWPTEVIGSNIVENRRFVNSVHVTAGWI